MRRRYIISMIVLVAFSLFLVACNVNSSGADDEGTEKESEEIKNEDEKVLEEVEAEDDSNVPDTNEESNQEKNLICVSLDVMELIKNKDWEDLSDYIHPSKGVRFTPYFFVDIQNDQLLTSQEIANLNQNNSVLNWGVFDGTGDPIDLNFSDYYDRFIFDHDYTNPHMIGINTPIGVGNMIDNVASKYPNGEYIEYHFTGFDSQYEGMDWRSLRLVFEEDGGTWFLVGVVHGEWTI